MPNEEMFQLYDEQGKVDDPDIAREMAIVEAPYHKKRLGGLLKPSETKITEGEQKAHEKGQEKVDELNRELTALREKAAHEAMVAQKIQDALVKAERYIPKPPTEYNTDKIKVDNAIDEGTRVGNLIAESLLAEPTEELPYKREIQPAVVKGLPNIFPDQNEYLLNNPFRQALYKAIEEALTKTGVSASRGSDETETEVRIRMDQHQGPNDYYRRNGPNNAESTLDVYVTRINLKEELLQKNY